jgi:hypothetical protein
MIWVDTSVNASAAGDSSSIAKRYAMVDESFFGFLNLIIVKIWTIDA